MTDKVLPPLCESMNVVVTADVTRPCRIIVSLEDLEQFARNNNYVLAMEAAAAMRHKWHANPDRLAQMIAANWEELGLEEADQGEPEVRNVKVEKC